MDVFWYRKGKLQQVHHSHVKNNLHQILREHDKIWIDMSAIGKEEEELLEVFFNIHPLTIEDCQKGHSRPKLEEFDHYVFIVLYGLDAKGKFIQINFIIGEDFLITIQHQSMAGYEALKKDTARLTELLARDTEFVMHNLIDFEVDKYYPILERFDAEIERLEARSLAHTGAVFAKEVFNLKHQLLALKHHLGPQREILYQLSHSQKFFEKSSRDYFRDVYDHVVHALDDIDNYREILTGVLDVHLSVTSNHLNDVIRVLTVFSTVFLPLTLIASIYGMNFDVMPELRWTYGYVFALVLMLIIAIIMRSYFKNKKWV